MNVIDKRLTGEPRRRAFTVGDVLRMQDAGIVGAEENFELIEGDIVMMAAKGIAHERIKSELLIRLARVLPEHLTVGVETSLRLTDTTFLEPDIAVFPRRLFESDVDRLASLEPGVAVLIVEVAVSSLAYDRQVKAALLARQRVQEFWVVDAESRVTWVRTGPRGEDWSSIVERGPAETLTVAALPGFAIRLADV